jgi:hypothetical protein
VIAAAVVACHPEREQIVYTNQTSGPVAVYAGETLIIELEAGEAAEVTDSPRSFPRDYRAFDLAGRLVFERYVTWDELEAEDFVLAIE